MKLFNNLTLPDFESFLYENDIEMGEFIEEIEGVDIEDMELGEILDGVDLEIDIEDFGEFLGYEDWDEFENAEWGIDDIVDMPLDEIINDTIIPNTLTVDSDTKMVNLPDEHEGRLSTCQGYTPKGDTKKVSYLDI